MAYLDVGACQRLQLLDSHLLTSQTGAIIPPHPGTTHSVRPADSENVVDTRVIPLLPFIRTSLQLALPLFQRWYDWEISHCERLFDDAMRAGSDPGIHNHYLGAVTTTSPHPSEGAWDGPLVVADGQQRLTTVSLLLEAIARNMPANDSPAGFAPDQIRARYLHDPLETGIRRYKLLLTHIDRQTLLGLLHEDELLPPDPSPRLVENFNYFCRKVRRLSTPDLHALCNGLAKFVLVHTMLHPALDDPLEIFETENDAGKRLWASDMIRNFLLMHQTPEMQQEIYTKHLLPLELEIGRDNFDQKFAAFVRAFLALRTAQRPSQPELYRAFKGYAISAPVRQAPRIALTEDLHTLGRYYCAISCGTEQDPELHQAFQRLLELRAEPALPLLLRLYQECARCGLQKSQFAKIVRTVENYLMRRAVCALHPGSHIQTFTRLARSSELGPDDHFDHVKTQLLLQSESARFPTDEEFLRTLESADLYSRPCAQHVLISLENYDRKEPIVLDEYSVEHIMPQQSPLPQAWRDHLGPEHQRIHDRSVHTLGNLTLSRYNSELSALPFAKKRDHKGGYRSSPLQTLNADLRHADAWTEEALQQRGQRLARLALSVWSYPSVPVAMLDEARKRAHRVWTLEHHPQLLPGAPMRHLYDRVCQEALLLGLLPPELLRKYISFKYEGVNVLDLIPQHHRLRCYLNTTVDRLADPHGMAVEHHRSKHSGAGHVLVMIETESQIPALVELVRQVLDQQQA